MGENVEKMGERGGAFRGRCCLKTGHDRETAPVSLTLKDAGCYDLLCSVLDIDFPDICAESTHKTGKFT